jgi:hypothetical protein
LSSSAEKISTPIERHVSRESDRRSYAMIECTVIGATGRGLG